MLSELMCRAQGASSSEPHGASETYKLSTGEGKPRGSHLMSLHILLHCRNFRDFSFWKQG